MEAIDDIRAIASNFEAKKIGMTQDKNGHILKLVIHPDEIPHDVVKDLVGTRYMVALVRVNDNDEPVASKAADHGMKSMRLVFALCADAEFQMWLVQQGLAEDATEEAATEAVKEQLGIVSRSELKQNEAAQRRLADLRDQFADHYRRR